jgi:hypothetical protein
VNEGKRSFGSGAATPAVRTRGQLGPTSLAELLAEAYNFAFTGTLGIEPDGDAPSRLWIEHGAVRGASGPWQTDALKEDALSGLLPPDILSLARRHAKDYGLELFEAVESLKLLPPDGLAAAREALVLQAVRGLAALPDTTHYELYADPAQAHEAHLSAPIEPLNLILVCVLAGKHPGRVESAVAAFGERKVSLDPIGARSLLATLSGPIRSLVDGLMRSPLSVEELKQRGARPSEPLQASLYVLWLTHHLRIFDAPALSRPPTEIKTPPFASSPPATTAPPPAAASSRPPSVSATRSTSAPAPSDVPRLAAPSISGIPPRRTTSVSDIAPSDPGRADREHRARERAMEAKVEEAWSLAHADQGSVPRLASFASKAASLFPKNARIGFHLACFYERDGRPDDARAELERVVAFDPEFEEAQSMLWRLRGGGSGNSVGARLKRLFGGKD